MARDYRLVVSAPATKTTAAKEWEFSGDSGNVLSIETELKKEQRRISYSTAKVSDPGWAIFSALPDPAYYTVPVKLYLAKPGNSQDVSFLTFDGKVTELDCTHPAPETLTIVAHDRSIDMRKKKAYRSFANKTSVEIAREIARSYGYEVDVDTGTVSPPRIAYDTGPNLSDWDFLARALGADGLEVYFDPKSRTKIIIRQKATTPYRLTIKRGAPEIISFSCKVLHIRGSGGGGEKTTVLDAEGSGTAKATPPGSAAESEAQRSGTADRGHRVPIGRHAVASPWSPDVDLKRRRKDTASLVCTPLPDLTLANTIAVSGFGGKADGPWFIDSIRHDIVKSDILETSLSMHRQPSKAADKSIGLAPEQTAPTTASAPA